MENNNLNLDDLTMDANSLESAINGLDSFIFHNISSTEVKTEDISALSGLLVSIKLLATKHANELSEFSIGGNL
ncbi:hypothetical protein ACQUD0_04600 [Vagococcus fluvialis]|uniref:hypothetical protein n=1 Tax=Vagococcus fluvialis TaxID=2738 RepID=UPI003D139BD0